jgi:hypothetical protein
LASTTSAEKAGELGTIPSATEAGSGDARWA